MAQIYHAIDTEKVIMDFEITNFLETGTGIGDTVRSVLALDILINVFSIEVMEELFNDNVKKLGHIPNLHLELGYTHEVLPELLKELQGPTLFFHDAHFPGADFGLAEYTDEKDSTKNIPLETELNIIKQNRDISHDCFVLDDLWVYEDGPQEAGNWPLRSAVGTSGMGFVYPIFRDTHHIIKSYAYQGFIIALPAHVSPSEMGQYIIGDNFVV